jgi:hypothetical protein
MKSLVGLAISLLILASSSVKPSVIEDLAKPRDYESCRVSSYDRWGGNGDGSQGNPVKIGEVRTIADIRGPGEIAHIWFTMAPFDKDILTNVILRMYWDDETTPSVESPIGAFFGLGHGKDYSFDSLPFSVGNNRGLNCFFPMPFNKRARIEIENQSDKVLEALYYYIDYKKFGLPRKDILYFHAQYRQAKPALSRGNYVALEARGRGHYVGMFYYIRSNSGGWWGEGDDMIYIDDSVEPTLNGTGMEDYFGGAWGMKPGQTFSRFGAPLFEVYSFGLGNENTAYRWHIEDAITFRKSIRVTHEHGTNNDRNDDFFSVAFWYQTEPHAKFPPLPSKFERLSFEEKKKALLESGKIDEYTSMLQNFIRHAMDPEARLRIMEELIDHYVKVGDKVSASIVLQSLLGPLPVEGLVEQVRETAEKFGVENISLPTSDICIVNAHDGWAILDQVNGSKCFRTDRSNSKPFIYFKVQNSHFKNVEKDLVLEVECCSPSPARLLVEYNSPGQDRTAKYRQSAILEVPASTTWQTVKINLPRALLSGVQNAGADFRICNLDGDIWIRKAKLLDKQ